MRLLTGRLWNVSSPDSYLPAGTVGMVQSFGTLAQLVQSAALTEQRSLVRAQYVPL